MKKILILCTCIITFNACTQYSSDYKKAVSENDSLKLELKKSEAEMNEMLSILNAIEEDIQSIREAEDFLIVQKDSELTGTRRQQIKNNMSLITETLKKNKQQLAELQEKLNKSSVQSTALQKTIDRLTNDINEKSKLIIKLQSDLTQKDEQIKELSTQVEGLSDDIKILEDINILQSETIDNQDKSLNTVYYCFGTKKELKEQNILSGGGLFTKSKALQGDFNKDYFITIDRRSVREIPLYSSKAKIRTNHPEGTFKLVKDEDGNLTLEISNVNNFWSLSSFLVIEVG